jgi:hypothetical protein
MVMIPLTLKVSGSRASTPSSTSTTAPSSSSSTSTEVSGREDDPENLFLKETLESFFFIHFKMNCDCGALHGHHATTTSLIGNIGGTDVRGDISGVLCAA